MVTGMVETVCFRCGVFLYLSCHWEMGEGREEEQATASPAMAPFLKGPIKRL